MNTVKTNETLKILEILGHELKTPLTSVSFNIQAIKRIIESDSLYALNLLKERAEVIENKTKQMSGLIDQLMDWFRSEVSEIKMTKNLIHTHDFLQEMVEKLKVARVPNILLGSHRAKDYCTILCDKERVFQVFHNVAVNLNRYNQINDALNFSTTNNDSHARLQIRVKNLKLEDHHIQSLFENFFHPQWIVDAHNGKIWVESNLEIGTAVILEIPKTSLEELKTHP